MSAAELRLVQEQLNTLLAQGEWDSEEAVEVATLAGVLERAGSVGHWTERARTWRDARARALLDEGLDEVDTESLLTAMADNAGEVERLDDALFDLDEALVAFWWAGRAAEVQPVSALAAELVRTIPSAFADLAAYASDLLGLPGVGDGPWAVWESVAESVNLEAPSGDALDDAEELTGE